MTDPTDGAAVVQPSPQDEGGGGGFWFFLAVVLVAVGFFVMFFYPYQSSLATSPGWGHIVGNDADNLIIIATRGVGFIAAGVVFALLGVGSRIASLGRR